MKISDLDVAELVDVIGQALVPVLYRGLDASTAPHVWRERSQLNAELMGRLVAVIQCGDVVGPDVFPLIDVCTARMAESYAESFGALLGPAGSLSKL
ncbi:hypothetical protein [Pseudomonas sp. Ld6]|uniref:hypothetical protein n=1 Tax=Pseudomonas sp. Ld6 TaxID=649167 RepID=UPI00386B5609